MFDICRGEERRRKERTMSICLTWFPFSELGKPKLYHDSGVFYKNVVVLLGGCLTVKNYWELLTGDDGVGFRVLILIL